MLAMMVVDSLGQVHAFPRAASHRWSLHRHDLLW